jgi:hypothetical protein
MTIRRSFQRTFSRRKHDIQYLMASKADKLTASYEPIVYTMRDSQHLTAYYADSFTFYILFLCNVCNAMCCVLL